MKKGNILNNNVLIVGALVISMVAGLAQNCKFWNHDNNEVTVVKEYKYEKSVSVAYDSVHVSKTVNNDVVKDVDRVEVNEEQTVNETKATIDVTAEEKKESVLYDSKYSLTVKEIILEEKIAKSEEKKEKETKNALANIGNTKVIVELVEPKVIKPVVKATAVKNVVKTTTTVKKPVAVAKKVVVKPATVKKTVATKKVVAKPVVKKTTMNASQKDVMYLACIVFAEAGGESYQGKLAVANVVLNRKKSSRYPNSVYGVISQRGQFGPFRNGSLNRAITKYQQGYFSRGNNGYTQSLAAAKAALNGSNNIGNRYSFNTSGPAKALRIGHHKFW